MAKNTSKLIKVIQNPEKLDPNMKLKIGDIPLANNDIVKEVANYYDLPIAKVEEIISFMGHYTVDVIRAGSMETVMLPKFGKFAPNVTALKAKTKRIAKIVNASYLLELAMKGKNIIHHKQINPVEYNPDETI